MPRQALAFVAQTRLMPHASVDQGLIASAPGLEKPGIVATLNCRDPRHEAVWVLDYSYGYSVPISDDYRYLRCWRYFEYGR